MERWESERRTERKMRWLKCDHTDVGHIIRLDILVCLNVCFCFFPECCACLSFISPFPHSDIASNIRIWNIWDQTRNWAVTILHFVQCSGGKSSDSQEQESLAIQLLFLSAYNRIPGVMIDLFDNLVSICQFLCLIYFFLMNLYGVPAPSYEKLYKSGQIFTSVGIIKWTFNGIDLNKKVNHRLACDLHAPIQTLHHRWHQESLFYLDL